MNITKAVCEGLVLNKSQSNYLDRLIKHNWLYALCDSNMEYRHYKALEHKLKSIADAKGGNYKVLFERVETRLRRVDRLREVKHTFWPC